ncbi:MAG: glycosyltransferase [Candidatus Buchananbacteria bacterium]
MKIALIHDHLVQNGGAEQVVKALKDMYSEAPIFTLLADKKVCKNFNCEVNTSFLQNFPLSIKKYQWFLPLMPAAAEALDLMGYDLILSSASSFAKGVIVNPKAIHICYCHTPTRYLWNDTHSYIQNLNVNDVTKIFLPLLMQKLRIWDSLAASRVDHFIANSQNIQRKIERYYGRQSEVIYPPVNTDNFFITSGPKKYFLAGSRLVPYKRIDLAVKAFTRLGIPLKIFGVGPEMMKLKEMAGGNIEFLGDVSPTEKAILYSNCLAYINPQDEDFGITAVEAMASGRPVIAYRSGGALESIIEGITGDFFDEQCWEDLADKIIRFDNSKYDSEIIRNHAKKFDISVFRDKFGSFVNKITQNENRH